MSSSPILAPRLLFDGLHLREDDSFSLHVKLALRLLFDGLHL
jgi:hypothetical protein